MPFIGTSFYQFLKPRLDLSYIVLSSTFQHLTVSLLASCCVLKSTNCRGGLADSESYMRQLEKNDG